MSTIQVTIQPRVRTSTVLRTGATGLPGAAGSVGPQGPAGANGSDATVTSGNIATALGFAPIGDAPANGTEYARKNGAWVAVTGGGGGGSSLFELNQDGDIQPIA